jgi:hypothetical protein
LCDPLPKTSNPKEDEYEYEYYYDDEGGTEIPVGPPAIPSYPGGDYDVGGYDYGNVRNPPQNQGGGFAPPANNNPFDPSNGIHRFRNCSLKK